MTSALLIRHSEAAEFQYQLDLAYKDGYVIVPNSFHSSTASNASNAIFLNVLLEKPTKEDPK